jgi:hypothetical protein
MFYVQNRKAVVSFSRYGELDVLMNVVQVFLEHFLPIRNFEILRWPKVILSNAEISIYVRFEFPTAVFPKIQVFWSMMLHLWHFEGMCCLHLRQAVKEGYMYGDMVFDTNAVA